MLDFCLLVFWPIPGVEIVVSGKLVYKTEILFAEILSYL